MTILSCEELIGSYLAELRGSFECAPSTAGCFLSTPFVRPDGEGIEIELQELPDGLINLTDMGDTLSYLYVNGLTLSQALVANARQIGKQHGVTLDRQNQFFMQVSPAFVGEGVHRIIQTILAVTDLIQKRRPMSGIRFDDDVESLIIYKGVSYDVGFAVSGARESHTVKFHVNSGRNLLIQPGSSARETSARIWAEQWAYRFKDILSVHSDWRPVAVLDDRNQRAGIWTSHAMTPIKEYAVMWSRKSELESLLEQGSGTSS